MRAHAPFPVLLATAVVWIAFLLLPASLLAKAPKKHVPRQPKAAHHPKPVRPRSKVHKASKRERHVGLPEPPRHRVPTARTASSISSSHANDATQDRVHAWVRNQESVNQRADPGNRNPSPASSMPASSRPTPTGVSTPPVEPLDAANPARPISVIGTVRGAATIGANKPQLPPVEELVAEPVILPTLYNKRGRLIVPPALKGSHEILLHQNEMADSDGLGRVRDDDDLDRMRRAGSLVSLPTNSTLRVDERLPANRRYCRPWTALFLDTLGRQHYAHFQTALQVNSAVRTVEFQQRLIHTNGNAAPAEGDTASPHLTGQAIDIAKRGLSMAEIAWMRGYLLPLVQQGKVDVEEEFQQSCFHISVYKKYMPLAPEGRRVIATTHREGMGALGMSLR